MSFSNLEGHNPTPLSTTAPWGLPRGASVKVGKNDILQSTTNYIFKFSINLMIK